MYKQWELYFFFCNLDSFYFFFFSDCCGQSVKDFQNYGLPELCWIIVGKVDTFLLFLILGEYFQFFTIENNVCCRLIIYSLYYVEIGSSMPIFWRVLIINGCWILSKAFSASIEIIKWFLSFNLLIWFITLIDLHILKNPCIPGINPTWSWCMSFLMCCWTRFAKILLRIFSSMFISDIGL